MVHVVTFTPAVKATQMVPRWKINMSVLKVNVWTHKKNFFIDRS